jgi:hypothetical protein
LLKKFVAICFYPIFALPIKKGTGELVAQLVEQYTFNVWALGSSPSQFTKKNLSSKNERFFYVAYFIIYSEKLDKYHAG